MEQFLQKILSLIEQNIGFIPVLVGIYFISMLMFWYESKRVKKNRNSIFDQWFLITTFMIFWGRVTYVITNWGLFSKWNWFYLPYERYGDQIYVFRAMPWRLLAIWDGGFLFIPMFLAYIVVSYFYAVFIKKWRWREMMVGVLFSSNFLLGSTLFMYGVYIIQRDIAIRGFILVVSSLIFQLFIKLIRRVYKDNINAYVNMAQVLIVVFALLEIWFLTNTFFSQDITMLDRYHVYGFIAFSLYMVIAYLVDVRRESDDSGVSRSILPKVSLNQAIKVRQQN